MGKQNLVQKTILFHFNDENEMRVFHLVDKVRYSQSHLIIKLLDDFFREYNLNEDTPYDHFVFVINSYIESSSSDMMAKSQIMNMMAMKQQNQFGQPMLQPPPGYPYAPFLPFMNFMQAIQGAAPPLPPPAPEEKAKPKTDREPNTEPDEKFDENDAFLDSLTSGFDSMLD